MGNDKKRPIRTSPLISSIYAKAILFGIAYFVLAKCGAFLSIEPGHFVNFWLPSGLFLATLLLNKKRDWPLFILSAIIANNCFDFLNGQSFSTGLLFAGANCCEALIGAWLVQLSKQPLFLNSVRQVGILIGSGAIGASIGAILGTTVVTTVLGGSPFKQIWAMWWSGDMLGILLMTPFAIIWLPELNKRKNFKVPNTIIEPIILLVLLFAASFYVFNHHLTLQFPLKYILLPIVVLVAIRSGMFGVSIAHIIVALTSARLAALGIHDVAVAQLPPIQQVISLQLFLMVVSIIGLLAATLLAERKKIEAQFKDEQFRLSEIIQGTKVGTWEWNVQTGETIFNERWAKMIGYSLKELMPVSIDTWTNHVHPEDLKKCQSQLEKHFRGESAFYECECRIKHKAGHWVWVMDRGSVSSWTSDGLPLIMFGSHTDISDRKRAEEKRLTLEKLNSVGTLAGGIAHDFNNILSGLYGNIALAKNKMETDHPGFKFLDAAEKSMARATLLTGQLLTFAKGGHPVTETLCLEQLVEEVVQFNLSGSNVKLEISVAENLWLVKADQGQLQQVFGNLTINAKQAMPNGGYLKILMRNADPFLCQELGLSEDRYVQISVSDNGTGIAPEHLGQIFDPYFSTKQTGSGLGLATIYSIIKKHRGQISVDSKLGEGTTFTLFLPASDETNLPEKQQKTVLKSDSSVKVLVMDDEEMIRETITALLEELNYSVVTSTDGEQALELYQRALAQEQAFDLVILDLTIPGGIGGKEAAENILRLDPNAKLIVSSGYADDPVMANYFDYGFKGIITKPYSLTSLSKVLVKVISF